MKNYPKLNKKASIEWGSQIIFWIPRILYIIVFILSVTAPTFSFSNNQQELLKKIESYNTDLAFFKLKNCIENHGFSNLDICFDNKNIGVKIIAEKDIFINKDKYDEKNICKIDKNCFIPEQKEYFVKLDNEIKKINIDMVVFIG